MINDFILLYYTKRGLASPVSRFLRLTLTQLDYWYPDAVIHILTNSEGLPQLRDRVQIHYNPLLPNSWEAKLHIFGLLDRPAMYIDLDVLLIRHFDASMLETKNPFRFYWSFGPGLFRYSHYNSAVAWIAEPDKAIVKELVEIYHREGYDQKGPPYHGNDEYATNQFIHEHKWVMPYRRDVNVPKAVAKDNIRSYQSIHYQLNAKTDLPHDLARILPLKESMKLI